MFGYPNDRFDAFVAPARRRAALWQGLIGLGVIALGFVGSTFAVLLAPGLVAGREGIRRLGEELIASRAPIGMLLILLTFWGMAAGVALAVRLVHRRPVLSLIGPDLATALRQGLRCFVLVLGLFVAGASLLFVFDPPRANLAPGLWLAWLPLALCLVFIQITAEELVFRGYLLQQLAARFRSPLVWGVLPAVVFAAVHLNPGDHGANAPWVVAAIGLFALAATDLTVRAGNLGPAIAFHFANNIIALLLVSLDGPMTGFALYVTAFSADDVEALRPWLLLDAAGVVLAWVLCRIVVAKDLQSRARPLI